MEHFAYHIAFYAPEAKARPVALLVAAGESHRRGSSGSLLIARDSGFLSDPRCDRLNRALDEAWARTRALPHPEGIPAWMATARELIAPNLTGSEVRPVWGAIADLDDFAQQLANLEGLEVPPEAWLPHNREDLTDA